MVVMIDCHCACGQVGARFGRTILELGGNNAVHRADHVFLRSRPLFARAGSRFSSVGALFSSATVNHKLH